MWCATFFNPEAAVAYPLWGLSNNCDTSATKKDLAIKFTDSKKSITDMCEALIDCGYVPDYRKTGGAPNNNWMLAIMVILVLLTLVVATADY